jgi:hypothetical protein
MPPNSTSANCQASSCKVTACAPNWYNSNGAHADGCECQADAIANTCGGATNLGTVPIGANSSVNGNLVPTGDEDWYQITFQTAATCAFDPEIILNAGGAPVRIQVFTNCSASAFTCAAGGTSGAAAGFLTWEYNHSALCGNNLPIDPTPATAPGYITVPTTVWVRVFATASSTTCLPYTLSWGN